MNDQKTNNQTIIIEDLTVNQASADEVKGGPVYMKYDGIKGSVSQAEPTPSIATDYVERVSK